MPRTYRQVAQKWLLTGLLIAGPVEAMWQPIRSLCYKVAGCAPAGKQTERAGPAKNSNGLPLYPPGHLEVVRSNRGGGTYTITPSAGGTYVEVDCDDRDRAAGPADPSKGGLLNARYRLRFQFANDTDADSFINAVDANKGFLRLNYDAARIQEELRNPDYANGLDPYPIWEVNNTIRVDLTTRPSHPNFKARMSRLVDLTQPTTR